MLVGCWYVVCVLLVLSVCWWVVGVLLEYVGELLVCYWCVFGMLVSCQWVIGVLLICCWYVGGLLVSFKSATTRFGTFVIIEKCQNAL